MTVPDPDEIAARIAATEREVAEIDDRCSQLDKSTAETAGASLGELAAFRAHVVRCVEAAAAEGDELGVRRLRVVLARSDAFAGWVEASYADQVRRLAEARFDLLITRRDLVDVRHQLADAVGPAP